MPTLSPSELDAQVLALSGLVDFRRFDDVIPGIFSGLLPSATVQAGIAQSCPPTGSALGSAATSMFDNVGGAYAASSTSAVPLPFDGDTHSKAYYYGGTYSRSTHSAEATLAADTIRLNDIRIGHTGEVTEAYLWLDGAGSGAGSQVCRAVLYSDSGGVASSLLGTSDEVTITDGQAATRVTFTFSTPITIPSSGKYWLGVHGGGNTNTIRVLEGTGSLTQVLSNADAYSGGAAASYVGNASTGLGRCGFSLRVVAAPTPRSIDFSSHPATVYLDANSGKYAYTSSSGRTIVLSDDFSVGGWFRVTTMPTGSGADNYHGLWGDGDSTGGGEHGYGLVLAVDGSLLFYRLGTAGPGGWDAAYTVQTPAGMLAADGDWHNVIVRSYGANLEIWVDGVMQGQNASATTIGSTNYPIAWGMLGGDFSVAGVQRLFRGYMHRCWLTQEKVGTEFIAFQQGVDPPTLEPMTCDDLTAGVMTCDTLVTSGQSADTLTIDAMVCE